MRIFEAIFNYSIISPPLVLKPQSGEIGGAYFRVSTVVVFCRVAMYHWECIILMCVLLCVAGRTSPFVGTREVHGCGCQSESEGRWTRLADLW